MPLLPEPSCWPWAPALFVSSGLMLVASHQHWAAARCLVTGLSQIPNSFSQNTKVLATALLVLSLFSPTASVFQKAPEMLVARLPSPFFSPSFTAGMGKTSLPLPPSLPLPSPHPSKGVISFFEGHLDQRKKNCKFYFNLF